MKELLSGNETIARGAYEANVWVVTGYPGTPSSEIIKNISEKYPGLNSDENVALETALGSSIAGVRSMVTMKHVGLNVTADPLLTAAYTGINAGRSVVVTERVRKINAYKKEELKSAITKEMNCEMLSVIIVEEIRVISESGMKNISFEKKSSGNKL